MGWQRRQNRQQNRNPFYHQSEERQQMRPTLRLCVCFAHSLTRSSTIFTTFTLNIVDPSVVLSFFKQRCSFLPSYFLPSCFSAFGLNFPVLFTFSIYVLRRLY